ncbi:flagella basal body P-ring formation protein FlgA [Endozoicomonas sp. OPT23]|uniref:flagellar basal body P-ring formation chaperone FlgA n=1 Tax=Endozoicomonas sp. OPT23 TaxID=2072845 RepID=UPI00129B8855|nr:flagellar basal body P-ring formation chaperone FlgA [Endozoicomonas sp. OPT23]MRI33934.1 flagella basal body P-ring formation protein FlgA [Endozoicomonas sp. OPT23]
MTNDLYNRVVILALTLCSCVCEASSSPLQQQLLLAAEQALITKARKLKNDHKAARYSIDDISIPGSISLQPCKQLPDVKISTAPRAGRQRLKLSCPENGWALFASGTIRLYKPVLTSLTLLSAGTKPGISQLQWQEKDIGELRRGYLTSLNELRDRQARRQIKAGTTLTPAMFKPEEIIQRGEEVILIVKTSTLEISMPGRSMEKGTMGKQIRVRNLSSNKVVRGIVSGKGFITVQ